MTKNSDFSLALNLLLLVFVVIFLTKPVNAEVSSRTDEASFSASTNSNSNTQLITNNEQNLLNEHGNDRIVRGLWKEELLLASFFIFLLIFVAYRKLT